MTCEKEGITKDTLLSVLLTIFLRYMDVAPVPRSQDCKLVSEIDIHHKKENKAVEEKKEAAAEGLSALFG